MITKFKLFEGYGNQAKIELIEQFGYDYINDYFMEHYDVDIKDILDIWPDIIKNHINDDKFVESWIDNEIHYQTIADFSDWEYKEYINENIDDEMEEEIIKLYKKSQGLDNNDDIISDIDGKVSIVTKNNKSVISITDKNSKVKKYKIPEDYSIVVQDGDIITSDTTLAASESLEYDESMLEDLDEEQLREVIENCNKEDEFVDYVVHKRYDGYDAMEIIEELYGKDISGEQLYNIVGMYLNEDDIVDEYKENESDDYKEDFLLQELEKDSDIYDYLIDKDENNILLLANYFEEEGLSPDITNEYDFQNKYIELTVKKYFEGSEYDEKEADVVIADTLVFLNNNFELNWQIEEEYNDHMWKIISSKYGM